MPLVVERQSRCVYGIAYENMTGRDDVPFPGAGQETLIGAYGPLGRVKTHVLVVLAVRLKVPDGLRFARL